MSKLIMAAVSALVLASATAVGAATSNYTVDNVAESRTATLHIPDGFEEDGVKAPVIVAFHGPGTSAGNFEYMTRILDEADKRGYVVIIPNGSPRSQYEGLYWNVAPFLEPGDDYSLKTDEEFVVSLIDFLDEKGVVDRSRIFATGFSMGGMMAYKLACNMSDLFSAIAVVAGAETTVSCTPAFPVSVFHLHGLKDDRVPPGGGEVFEGSGVVWPNVREKLLGWRTRMSCGAEEMKSLPGENYCFTSECHEGHLVRYCAAGSFGHEWPGRTRSKLYTKAYGEQKSSLDATTMILDFLDEVPGREIADDPTEEPVEEVSEAVLEPVGATAAE